MKNKTKTERNKTNKMTKKKQKKQNPASFSLLLRIFDEKN